MQAISALCQKYPRKHSVMMNFLSNMLRDDVSDFYQVGRQPLVDVINDSDDVNYCWYTNLLNELWHYMLV